MTHFADRTASRVIGQECAAMSRAVKKVAMDDRLRASSAAIVRIIPCATRLRESVHLGVRMITIHPFVSFQCGHLTIR